MAFAAGNTAALISSSVKIGKSESMRGLVKAGSSTLPASEEENKAASALVLGWFGAKDNELEFVKKLYKKKGYADVTVAPSLIASCSKPRGWYRTVKETSAKFTLDASNPASKHANNPLSRHFDVVHVLSGGFLNLYLQLLSGAAIDFDTLVLDSTPILPKPTSFTRFARAYMATMPKPISFIPKIVPAWLHLTYVTARWGVASWYVAFRHQLSRVLQALKGSQAPLSPGSLQGPRMLGAFAPYAATNRYDVVVANCVETVFQQSRQFSSSGGKPLKAVFVTNPADPYLNYDDVKATMARATELGCDVHEVEGYKDHVKSIFRKPAAIFAGPLELKKEKKQQQPAPPLAPVEVEVTKTEAVTPSGEVPGRSCAPAQGYGPGSW